MRTLSWSRRIEPVSCQDDNHLPPVGHKDRRAVRDETANGAMTVQGFLLALFIPARTQQPESVPQPFGDSSYLLGFATTTRGAEIPIELPGHMPFPPQAKRPILSLFHCCACDSLSLCS